MFLAKYSPTSPRVARRQSPQVLALFVVGGCVGFSGSCDRQAATRSAINPDAIADGVAVLFDVVPDRKRSGKFEAQRIELVE